jgi:hypothetical protein
MGNRRELTLSGPAREAALREMYAEINARNMFPFWARASDVEHDEIRQLMSGPKPVPFRWSYKDDIESLLHRRPNSSPPATPTAARWCSSIPGSRRAAQRSARSTRHTV